MRTRFFRSSKRESSSFHYFHQSPGWQPFHFLGIHAEGTIFQVRHGESLQKGYYRWVVGFEPTTQKKTWSVDDAICEIIVVIVVLTLTRIIKSVVTGQAPSTLELRNTPGKKHKQTKDNYKQRGETQNIPIIQVDQVGGHVPRVAHFRRSKRDKNSFHHFHQDRR